MSFFRQKPSLNQAIAWLLCSLLAVACAPDWGPPLDGGGARDAGEPLGDSALAPEEGAHPPLDASSPSDASGLRCDAECDAERTEEHGDPCATTTCGDGSGPPDCGTNEIFGADEDLGTCACTPGYTRCDATAACHDLESDPAHCGSCGYKCADGLRCVRGMCEQRIRELVLGGNRSCVLYEGSSGVYPVKCWGDGRVELYRDGSSEAPSPRSIDGVDGVRALALSIDRQCAVPATEDVIRCWGKCGAACGLPSGISTNDAAFANVSSPGVTRLGMSRTSLGPSTCALSGSGRLHCWGAAVVANSDAETNSPVLIVADSQRTFTDVAVGVVHACAVAEDSSVACWGFGGTNTLGVATASLPSPQRSRGVAVLRESGGKLTEVVDVEAGLVSCALTIHGDVWCWGDNTNGWLGVGDTAEHAGAVKVDLSEIVQVDVGGAHICALSSSGDVYCWGSTKSVGLGVAAIGDVSSGQNFSVPQKVPGLSDALEIQTGEQHTCARLRSGQVLCWGANGHGQLGDGTKIERFSPSPVQALYP